jgi:hypothetical protein
LTVLSDSNHVLTGSGQNFPDDSIRVRAEILFPAVSQRTDCDNSDGHQRRLSLAEAPATGILLFQTHEKFPLAEDW